MVKSKKVDPRAEEALVINTLMREQATRRRVRRSTTGKRVSVEKDSGIWMEDCRRSCTRCPGRFRCYTERDVVFTLAEWKKIDACKGTGKTLKEWEDSILSEIPWVDIKNYSHNIISLVLNAISQGWGQKKANSTIDKFGLERLGWRKETVKRSGQATTQGLTYD